MMRAAVCLLFAGLVIGSSATTQAQGKFPPEKFVNLQIFPKDAPPDVVIAAMNNFSRALGVRCQFCHVGEEGVPLDKFDFASDAKPHKQTARMMMRMAGEINGQLTKAMPDAPSKGYQVTRATRATAAPSIRSTRPTRRSPARVERSPFCLLPFAFTPGLIAVPRLDPSATP